ncbi:hypothetical protein [Myceligenerans indicum]|uniref:AAA+ ATPase domain-containing protein n=1 Tax=Myceligenerans indicum TaxID=2593663 RepID=A0ABS1LQI4_9MICO|nr:hypothetical protein [Myceligenerans indicum]MBL0888562.1 hypothetical protein [Myceligenerans indicum]
MIDQLDQLAAFARSAPDPESFRQHVRRPRATNEATRNRLSNLENLVGQAARQIPSLDDIQAGDLTWRWLSVLRVHVLHLEGTDTRDRTAAIATLRAVVEDGTLATADSIFSKILELTGAWAAQGGWVTAGMLRRELRAFPLKRSPSHTHAWRVLDRLAERLRGNVRPGLRAGSVSIELDRDEARSGLADAMRAEGDHRSGLVVTGEPDVGKSALALRVSGALRDEGASLMSMSLRDVPDAVGDFEARLGGASLANILASAEVRQLQLLLIDGTESVLEGKGPLLRELATAAFRAGRGVVAVTRADGAPRVREELMYAAEAAEQAGEPTEYVVPGLAANERQKLARAFPGLRRLASEPRAGWLLRRPGLVDALLRAGSSIDADAILCEADVFTAVWNGLIRRWEEQPSNRATPDEREQLAINVARRNLKLEAQTQPGRAAAELRSDGVLVAPENPALSTGDVFASDLFRDFALCRLFIHEEFRPLADAGAPRGTIRATRLACQAVLGDRNRMSAWADLISRFDQLGGTAGSRWVELPYEALLTLGDAEVAIGELWEALTADQGRGLGTLLRLAQLRYVEYDFGDPFALAPVLSVFYSGDQAASRRGVAVTYGPMKRIGNLVLAWLRGMARDNREPDVLRRSIRDHILDSEPSEYDAFAIEALATLGHDLDERAEQWLRRVAAERPDCLASAVESVAVAVSMSRTRPSLLLDLADAYYIERPDPDEDWNWGGFADYGDGIRDHRHDGGLAFGQPLTAWYYGPFYQLLREVPHETISLIDRMLDHAAQHRADRRARSGGGEDTARPPGIDIDLPDLGPRRFFGDDQMWGWYRGLGGGPYPCMSALLALERYLDFVHKEAGIETGVLVDLVLRACDSIAVAGLVVGFLTRRPDKAGEILDPFLAVPDVWSLEMGRIVGERANGQVRDASADTLTGSDRRRNSPQDIVAAMVLEAREDEVRRQALVQVGDQLVENARHGTDVDARSSEYVAMVEGWAAGFRIENYRGSSDEDGYVIAVERPTPVEEALASRTAEIQASRVLYQLQSRYASASGMPEEGPGASLREDIATARSTVSNGFPAGFFRPEDSIASVAAAALRAHALDQAEIDDADLRWAADTVLTAAERPRVDILSNHATIYPMGADRTAAAVVPLLLTEPFEALELDATRLNHCLGALGRSLFDEVRMAYARGCDALWQVPCNVDEQTGVCVRHEPAWQAALASLADCRRAPRNEESLHLEPNPLPPPYDQTLPAVRAADLLVNRLRMPILCAAAAGNTECIPSAAHELSPVLWDAYRRGVNRQGRGGGGYTEAMGHEAIARALIELTLAGDSGPLESHLRTFAGNPYALQPMLDGFARNFTYDERLRESLPQFWNLVLRTVLDAIDAGADLQGERGTWFDWAVAALLPTPTPRSSDPDIDGTLQRAEQTWMRPEALGDLADRWLALAAGEARAVDAVTRLARCAPLSWQATAGLDWIERTIDGKYEQVSNGFYYFWDWIRTLRGSGALTGAARDRFHRIVDGLASGGDREAVTVQRLDE